MAVNKLIIDGDVKFDLTSDTVDPDSLEEGITAHSSDGESITGLAKKTWVGTKDEYETEKDTISDGTLVVITDDYEDTVEILEDLIDAINGTNTVSIAVNDIYEIGERIVGEYLGNTLYRLVYTFPAGSGGMTSASTKLPAIVNFDYSDIDILVDCKMIMTKNDNTDFNRVMLGGGVIKKADGFFYTEKWANYYTNSGDRIFTWILEYTKR